MVDVSLIDMSVRLLGDTIDMPIGISPTAMQCLAHPDGEKATARGIITKFIYYFYPHFSCCKNGYLFDP